MAWERWHWCWHLQQIHLSQSDHKWWKWWKAVGNFKQRVAEFNGGSIGKAHNNPSLDTQEYEIEYEDGSIDCYFVNIIAKNIYWQVDSEGMNSCYERNNGSLEESLGSIDWHWLCKNATWIENT